MNGVRKKLPELDVLSGIAILCVVFIHSNAKYLLSILNLDSYTDAGFTVRLLDNFIHGAVPLFIFIAGYKYALNNIDDDYRTYIINKFTRVLIPFIVLSMLFLVRDMVTHEEKYNSFGEVGIQMLKFFGGYNPAYHLWYIPMYLFITLTYPYIYKILKNDKTRSALIILIVLLHRILGYKFDCVLERPFNFVYYYMFFEMGVLFHKYNIKKIINDRGKVFILLYVMSAIVLTFNPIPVLYEVIQDFLLWPLSIVAYFFLSIFLGDNKLLKYLGENSFYIYLLHEPIICTKIFWVLKSKGIFTSQICVFVLCILTLIFTIALYIIIKKIYNLLHKVDCSGVRS